MMSTIVQWLDFRSVILDNIGGVAGIVLFSILLNIFFLKFKGDFIKLVLKGGLLVFVGLVLFLQGVNIGFVPAGQALAEHMGDGDLLKWLLIPLGFILGLMVTYAEPSVKILSSQVEKTTSGAVDSRLLQHGISFGVAVFTALGMFRIIMGFPLLYVLIPGYILVLVMMLKCSPLFIGIAFDSSTVSTGPMIITFIMALAIGLSIAVDGRDPLLDGFGLVALIALAPIISVMIVGVLYTNISSRRS